MQKNVQCLLLKTGQVIVSEVVEVQSEIGDPDCKLVKPYLLNQSSFDMSPWLEFTEQDVILIRSDDVLTFAEPSKKILDNYLTIT